MLVCTLLLFLSLILLSSEVSSEVLTPPYFNLAEGRRITATATCGDDVSDRELYCKLTGADIAGRYGGSGNPLPPNLIQGQLCDYCDAFNHPPEYAIDGTERWWQSPPLSRDMQFNQVNLTIDLGQVKSTFIASDISSCQKIRITALKSLLLPPVHLNCSKNSLFNSFLS